MNHTEKILEFDKIKDKLCGFALSDYAKESLSALGPYLDEVQCHRNMQETTDARRIFDSVGNPPLSAIKGIKAILDLCDKGSMLTPEQLEGVLTFLKSSARMKSYLKKAENLDIGIAFYGRTIDDLGVLRGEIENAVHDAFVLDSASPHLRTIRRKIETESAQIKKRLEELLRSKKNMFSDSYVSIKNGRYVLPVKKEYKNQISGMVVDSSATGSTYFIEPSAASKFQDEINLLKTEEQIEISKILYTLSVLVDNASSVIKLNIEAMTALDIAFAKAKLSADMKAVPVTVNTQRKVKIMQGRHPLLKQDTCIPLDFSIGGQTKGIVITGPNTGGKTVALKTVGLLSMMAQSGLHVPVKEGTFCMNNLILCDIGDGQSITENLSTFSSHITNIIEILNRANQESLVLLDELGSGTDPAEGMGIAVSILEELRRKGSLFLATTHYPEVKEYAEQASGLVNARMAFDRESLQPLYRLEIGQAGESCALYIAKRLGFPAHMLERARQQAYRPERKENKQSEHLNLEIGETVETSIQDFPVTPKIQKDNKVKNNKKESLGIQFQIGDSVTVLPDNQIGIVFAAADTKGQVGVQIKGEKFFFVYKRIKLKTPASELYPPDYDFSVIFDSVKTRKTHHKMGKRHIPGLEVVLEEGKP